jgi:opacity protein-like surface antigen
MAKKNLALLIIVALAASGIFAQENEKPKTAFGLSAGVGGLINIGNAAVFETEGSMSGTTVLSKELSMEYFAGGPYAFFDAKYAELTLAFFIGGGESRNDAKIMGVSSSSTANVSVSSLNIGLLGKYPFSINNKLSVFPLLGIEYQAFLAVQDEDGNDWKGVDGDGGPGDFSALWFKLGGGLDYAFTQKLYLRFEALLGLRLPNKVELDGFDNDPVVKAAKSTGADVETTGGGSLGFTAKLAVGFKF